MQGTSEHAHPIKPQTGPTVNAGNTSKPELCFLVLILIASGVLMLAAAHGDLALDEIISLNDATHPQSWLGIFTEEQNDNNHLLNSLILRALGNQSHLIVYRLPNVMFGLLMLATLMVTARRLGKGVAVWAGCLAGLSFPVILYSSEARGYAPAMFFGVLAFELLQRCRERFTPARLIMFWLSLGLGFLAHFSFVMPCLALGLWLLVRERLAGVSIRNGVLNAVKYFGPPAAFAIFMYLFFIRHMAILGANPQTRWAAIADTAAQNLGFSDAAGLQVVSVIFALALFLGGLRQLFRQRRDEWIFFGLVLLVVPTLLVAVYQPDYLYFRYFCVCFPFFYLLLACLFAGWYQTAGKMKMIPVLLVVAITTGHIFKITLLLQLGRGQYRQALLDMAAATAGPIIVVCSDNDFRGETMLDFYSRFLPAGKQLAYIPAEKRHKIKPEWLVEHNLDPTFTPWPEIDARRIGKYSLFRVYPFSGATGWSWFVYHRELDGSQTEVGAAPPP